MSIPTLETKRLILKAVELKDAPSYQKYFNDEKILSHLSDKVPKPYPDNGAEFYIKNVLLPEQGNNYYFWGIFLKDNPEELIGGIEIRVKASEQGNRGFWLGQKFWN
jgi:ribosomal-protein-alanine N-acetyltransferase